MIEDSRRRPPDSRVEVRCDGIFIYIVKTYMVNTFIDIIINCCNIIITLPCIETGKRSFIPTPACIDMLKSRKSIINSNPESYL